MASLEQKVENLVEEILADYTLGRDIDRQDIFRHPDREVVVEIIAKLRRIVFPGYSREKNYRSYNSGYSLSALIEDVMFHLSRQISMVLYGGGMPQEAAEKQAQEITLEFLHKIPQLRKTIQTDVQAAFDGDPAAANTDEVIFSYPGIFAITVYRLAHELFRLNVPIIPRMMTEHAHSVTGIDIHPGAQIGDYFFIDHGTGVVIGETTVIGRGVKLYQGVTLGGLSTRGGQSLRGIKRHPTIGDNVTIYANASILGGDTVIGEGSVIGANAFVLQSVAANTTVTATDQNLQFKTRKQG